MPLKLVAFFLPLKFYLVRILKVLELNFNIILLCEDYIEIQYLYAYNPILVGFN